MLALRARRGGLDGADHEAREREPRGRLRGGLPAARPAVQLPELRAGLLRVLRRDQGRREVLRAALLRALREARGRRGGGTFFRSAGLTARVFLLIVGDAEVP